MLMGRIPSGIGERTGSRRCRSRVQGSTGGCHRFTIRFRCCELGIVGGAALTIRWRIYGYCR